MTNALNAPVCPKCGQLDAVRKVSAIVAAGVTSTTTQTHTDVYETGSSRLFSPDSVASSQHTAISYSVLAQRLAPSTKPKDNTPSVGCLLVLVTIPTFIFGSLVEKDNPCLIPVFFIINFLIIAFIFNRFLVDKEFPEKLATWEQEMDKWNRSYYCSRCDSVFIKEE